MDEGCGSSWQKPTRPYTKTRERGGFPEGRKVRSERLDELRARLIALREELREVEETGKAAADTVELDQGRVGRISRMDALQAQAMSIESNRRRAAQLKRIDAALARMERDEYGDCARCGEEIAPKRLDSDPTVLQCIDCAERSENLPRDRR